MDKNVAYLVLLVSAITLGISAYRLISQRKMQKAVCAKFNLEC